MKHLLFLILFAPGMFSAQHTITGVFSPAKDYNMVLLYKVTPTISEYITNDEVREDGSFQFKLDSTATKGIYRIVYAVPQEDYNFDVIYNEKEDIDLSFNSETGVTFNKSGENKLMTSYANSMSMITQSIGNYYRQNREDKKALKAIFKTQKEAQLNFEEAAKGTIALEFIKANKPYIPEVIEDVETYTENLKTHYFDHINFNNITLQSSNFLQERMLNYVFGVTESGIDEETNYKRNIDTFCNVIKTVPNEVKRILLIDLWTQMADLGNEPVANYISDSYLIDIAVALNDQTLIKDLLLYTSLSNGKKAPDFTVELEKDKKIIPKKLSELDLAQNYIIVFWSSMCSHCLDEIPRLQKFVKTKEQDLIQVIAIGLEEEPYKWKDLTYSYPEFIHVYGEGKWDNEIGDLYNVSATPTYFVLNKNKEIIAKPENFEDLKMFFGEE